MTPVYITDERMHREEWKTAVCQPIHTDAIPIYNQQTA